MKKILLTLAILFGLTPIASATLLDLSAQTASGYLNGALFSRTSMMGQGSGNLDPFVRLHANGTEQGYNTDGPFQFDEVGGVFTHSIRLSDIPLVTINNINYREFVLDAAEPNGGGASTLYIDKIELYLLGTNNASNYPFPNEVSLYTLGTGNSIKLDNITGNGEADMFAYVPDSVLANDPDPYLYFYSKFSQSAGSYEEWGVQRGVQAHTPEPATMMLLSAGLLGALLRKRRAA